MCLVFRDTVYDMDWAAFCAQVKVRNYLRIIVDHLWQTYSDINRALFHLDGVFQDVFSASISATVLSIIN